MNCVPEQELNQVVAYEKCVIKITHKCYCYDGRPRPTVFLFIEKPIIRNVDLANEMMANYTFDCNHIFIEGFDKCNDITFEPWLGS
jgi:hypothetical protein